MTVSTRTVRTLAATVATTASLVVGAAVASPAQARVEAPPPVSSWEAAPGRLGPVTTGMTRKELVRSGTWVRTRSATCGGTLRPRNRYLDGLSWSLGERRSSLEWVMTSRASIETTRGISVGDTLADVRRAYPSHLSGPRRGVDDQRYVVHRAGRRYLSFGLDGSSARATVVALSVSRGRAVQPYLDGCGY